MMNEQEIAEWQSKKFRAGDLLSIWDHETAKEVPCLIIDDSDKTINPFGRKSRIRKITIMSRQGIHAVSKYDIFPTGEARPSIPF